MKVVIIGASHKADRFAYKALHALLEHGVSPLLVGRAGMQAIEGIPVQAITEISPPIDTVTVYVNAEVGLGYLPEIKRLQPRRVILNPGTRSEELEHGLATAGITVVKDCTLKMLERGDF